MIQHVVERALQSGASETIVATDDDRVIEAVRPTGAIAIKTSSDHQSGSDRIMEVVTRLGWSADELVVNVQGDEPLIPPQVIDQVASLLKSHSIAGVATLFEPIQSRQDVFDPNVVKVVVSDQNLAMYFSRAPIPWQRGVFEDAHGDSLDSGWKRHIGIYAYRCATLRTFVGLPPSRLETTEALEQLRFLQNDMLMCIAEASAQVPGGVDTPEDVERILKILDD